MYLPNGANSIGTAPNPIRKEIIPLIVESTEWRCRYSFTR